MVLAAPKAYAGQDAAMTKLLVGLGPVHHVPHRPGHDGVGRHPWGSAASPTAHQEIPPNYLALYRAAADTCPELPWSVLAAIGKVETNHGRLPAPGVTSGANFAGAAGPMQIGIGGKAGNTFGAYAVDGDGDGISNIYNPADAIFTAASYLCRNGGGTGGDLSRAVFAYNHADWYVTKVLAIASTYEAAAPAARWGGGPAPPRTTTSRRSPSNSPTTSSASPTSGAPKASTSTTAPG